MISKCLKKRTTRPRLMLPCIRPCFSVAPTVTHCQFIWVLLSFFVRHAKHLQCTANFHSNGFFRTNFWYFWYSKFFNCLFYGTNKAGYTATEVACGWAGAVIKMVNEAFGQEQ